MYQTETVLAGNVLTDVVNFGKILVLFPFGCMPRRIYIFGNTTQPLAIIEYTIKSLITEEIVSFESLTTCDFARDTPSDTRLWGEREINEPYPSDFGQAK